MCLYKYTRQDGVVKFKCPDKSCTQTFSKMEDVMPISEFMQEMLNEIQIKDRTELSSSLHSFSQIFDHSYAEMCSQMAKFAQKS